MGELIESIVTLWNKHKLPFVQQDTVVHENYFLKSAPKGKIHARH